MVPGWWSGCAPTHIPVPASSSLGRPQAPSLYRPPPSPPPVPAQSQPPCSLVRSPLSFFFLLIWQALHVCAHAHAHTFAQNTCARALSCFLLPFLSLHLSLPSLPTSPSLSPHLFLPFTANLCVRVRPTQPHSQACTLPRPRTRTQARTRTDTRAHASMHLHDFCQTRPPSLSTLRGGRPDPLMAIACNARDTVTAVAVTAASSTCPAIASFPSAYK